MHADDIIFVDVDTQFDFMDETGALYVPGGADIIPTVIELIRLAGELSVPVLSSVDTHAPDDPEFAMFPPHCVKDTPGQQKIDGTITTDARQVIVEKNTFDVFSNDTMDDLPASEPFAGRRTAVVFGVATDYCVKSAVLGFAQRGYDVRVVSDAIAAVTAETGVAAVEEMRAAGATFILAEDVISLRP